MLEDRAGAGVEDLAQAADLLVQAARATRRELANVVNTFRSNVPPTRWTWTWTRCRPWAFPSPTPTTRCRLSSAGCT